MVAEDTLWSMIRIMRMIIMRIIQERGNVFKDRNQYNTMAEIFNAVEIRIFKIAAIGVIVAMVIA